MNVAQGISPASTDTTLSTHCRRFLDHLETRELKLLSWGITSASFTREEVIELAREYLEAIAQVQSLSPEELARHARNHRLILPVEGSDMTRFRSRMAETVRLLSLLRQWFRSMPSWEAAPRLVADFRLMTATRLTPLRTIEPDALVTTLKGDLPNFDPVMGEAVEALLTLPSGGHIRLADFQQESCRRVMLGLTEKRSHGTIVSAGTGTGKTLAFYVPALAYVASRVARPHADGSVKALAIYPRNELLKDQFAQAFEYARRLDPITTTNGGRAISIGMLNTLTPRSIEFTASWLKPDHSQKGAWRRLQGGPGLGLVCPFMRCPSPDCNGTLFWPAECLEAKQERLRCQVCAYEIPGEQLRLTRESLKTAPPDVLFTTTESLNRALVDMSSHRLFGIGSEVPRLVLLDEVHLYSGLSGAQTACLLRRWKYLVRRAPVEFVGLSATLGSAGQFFADLVGLPPSAVVEIQPVEMDEPKGREYRLALRGDPVSGTALQSATLQTAMLLRRCLDPWDDGHSQGLYGKQVFLFTDELDSVNRLKHNLEDAERQKLAELRKSTFGNPEAVIEGQSWEACERIGNELSKRLKIDRTSSQDSGVDHTADVVVATASLEVGFDSDAVGAVIQHKAPREPASFLQRIGRAGRYPTMRPWKVVVLSDFGRDRLAYQTCEQLFSPRLPARSVASQNRYVLRMQAVLAFMDWLATKIRPMAKFGSIWKDFSSPDMKFDAWQQKEADIIDDVLLHRGPLRKEMFEHVQKALDLSEDALRALLWDPPRALMTHVLPTISRRLREKWTHTGGKTEPFQKDRPLPEFVPQTLFTDLNLPEVRVAEPGTEQDLATLPVALALRLSAPGNVTRRFSPHDRTLSHWVEPEAKIRLETYAPETDIIGPAQYVGDDGQSHEVIVHRPWKLHMCPAPSEVSTTSRGTLLWKTQIGSAVDTEPWCPTAGGRWAGILVDARFFVHNAGAPALVRRFAPGARADVKRNRKEQTTFSTFVDAAAHAAAVGFQMDVDGMMVRLRVPANLVERLTGEGSPVARSNRLAFFRHRIMTDRRLDGLANVFQRGWFVELMLSALTAWAGARNVKLVTAFEQMRDRLLPTLTRALDAIFRSLREWQNVEDDAGTDNGDALDDVDRQRGAERVFKLLAHPQVQVTLLEHAPILWDDLDTEAATERECFLVQRFQSTLGHALLDACQNLCPSVDGTDLVLDLDAGPPMDGFVNYSSNGELQIWISETSPGGTGLVEQIQREIATDPGRFLGLLEAALSPSEFETVATQLTFILQRMETTPQVGEAVKLFRGADGYVALEKAATAMNRALTANGAVMTHAVRNALHTRIVRPGSSPATDSLLRKALRAWDDLEKRLDLEIDVRTIAYLLSRDDEIRKTLLSLSSDHPPALEDAWVFEQLAALLWPRGLAVRTTGLSSYNPFATPVPADREVLVCTISRSDPVIELGDDDWVERVRESLLRSGVVRLVARTDQAQQLRAALHRFLVMPLEMGYLQLHPRVDGLEAGPGTLTATLRLNGWVA